MEETLFHEIFNRVVVLCLHRTFELPIFFIERLHVTLVRTAESHHVHFLAVWPDDAYLFADHKVMACPNRNLAWARPVY